MELEGLLQEGEVVLVACAQNDCINFLGRTILEGAHLSFHAHQKRLGLKCLRPVECHGVRAVRTSYVFAPVLVALRSDVFGRVRRADDQNARIREFTSVSEIMGVQDSAFKFLKAREVWNVRHVEMPRAAEDVVEALGFFVVFGVCAFGR